MPLNREAPSRSSWISQPSLASRQGSWFLRSFALLEHRTQSEDRSCEGGQVCRGPQRTQPLLPGSLRGLAGLQACLLSLDELEARPWRGL